MIKLINLKENLEYEDLFWKHILNDVFEYYFFILDMKYFRDKTDVILAMDSEYSPNILGILLTYNNNVQIRGSDEAILTFVGKIDLSNKNVTLPFGSKKIIFEKFNPPESETTIIRMVFDSENSNFNEKQSYIELSPDNRNEIATLLKNADPVWWGDVDADRLMDEDRIWIGIKKSNILVSAVSAWVHDFAGNIATVATEYNHRKLGYASSLVSTIIRKLSSITNVIIIHVRSDNLSAISVYKKCGFKELKKFYMVKGLKKGKTN